MKLAIIGIGLIGGSMALKLKQRGWATHVIGVDNNDDNIEQALELGIIDEALSLSQAAQVADVLVLSTPVDAIVSLLPQILPLLNQHQILIEVGSTKVKILESIKGLGNTNRFLATHPMWGTEFSGPQAAMLDSFDNKAVVLCDEQYADTDVVAIVRDLYEQLGMYIISMTAEKHDESVAYISHISHITSFALANTVLEKEKEEKSIFQLASGGFESTVRLGKSSPEMWVPIMKQNRNYILDVLQEHIKQLQLFQTAIADEQWQNVSHLINDANQIKRILNKNNNNK